MAEPLIGSEHVVAEADPIAGGWSARGWVPGPAGTAGLVLAGGLELEVDVAAPGTFVGLWVPAAPSARAVGAVRQLLGDERAAALLGLTGGPVLLASGRDRRTTRLARRRPGAGSIERPGVAGDLATIALAEAATATTHPLARALAHLDAAVAGRRARRGIGRRGRARAAALAGIELLLDVARRGELDGQPVDGAALTAALAALVVDLPDGLRLEAQALRDAVDLDRFGLRRAARSHPADLAGFAAQVSPPPAAAAGGSRLSDAAPRAKAMRRPAPAKVPIAPLLELDRGGLPRALVGAGVAVRATTPSEAEVRLPRRADEAHRWWTRAHGPDGTVLAAAPFEPDGADAVARLLVPPEELRHATFDVTDQPGEPRPSSRALAAIAAVEAGQAAARAERLGRDGLASARWRTAARSWDEAGADAKAGLARRYADEAGSPTGRVPPPLLADPVLEALGDAS